MMFDIRNKTFDWFNNPYIYPNVYFMDQDWKPKLHKTVRMKKCSYEDLIKIIPENQHIIYPNSICFEDKS